MKILHEYLAARKPGFVSDSHQLESLLVSCWDDFIGSDAGGMTQDKLRHQIEEIQWNPPILSLVVARHAEAGDVSEAKPQHWFLNLSTQKAFCGFVIRSHFRQRQTRLDVHPLARKTVRLILGHREDKRLKWNPDGSVRVRIGKILPENSAVKRTLEGRRRRFRTAVGALLRNAGWMVEVEQWNVYAPPPMPCSSTRVPEKCGAGKS